MRKDRRVVALVVVVGLAAVAAFLGACSQRDAEGPTGSPASTETALRPYTGPTMPGLRPAEFPAYVGEDNREAYEFAVARPDVLAYMPCFCACGTSLQHTSDLDCFLDGVRSDGTIQFNDHAAGCLTCRGVALDAKKLADEGVSVAEIRTSIDQEYAGKGPATDTPLPPG